MQLNADTVLGFSVSFLDGETDTVEGHKYVVVERPDIRFQVGRA